MIIFRTLSFRGPKVFRPCGEQGLEKQNTGGVAYYVDHGNTVTIYSSGSGQTLTSLTSDIDVDIDMDIDIDIDIDVAKSIVISISIRNNRIELRTPCTAKIPSTQRHQHRTSRAGFVISEANIDADGNDHRQ